MHLPEPVFPPLLTGHGVKGADRPFETACARVAAGKLGAGDVLWSRNVTMLDLAVVLEPEVPLAQAAQMLLVATVAAGDAVGALVPPQVALTFTWPNRLRINGGVAGEMRGGVAGWVGVDDVPPWLVIGFWLRHLRRPNDPEPGEVPDITWLGEEGGADITRTELVESYCRHLLTWIHTWQADGFRAVHDVWVYRVAEERGRTFRVNAPAGQTREGEFLGLDEAGNLLLKEGGAARALQLADWFERSA